MTSFPQLPSWVEYLSASGLLEGEIDEANVRELKREYRRIYMRQYKRNARKEMPEIPIQVTPEANAKLDALSTEMQTSKAKVIRVLLHKQLDLPHAGLTRPNIPLARFTTQVSQCRNTLATLKNLISFTTLYPRDLFRQLETRLGEMEEDLMWLKDHGSNQDIDKD